MQIDDVGGAAAVDVGKADAFVVELVRMVEPRRIVHRNLGTEMAITKVRPVADFTVTNADDIGQPVAREVGLKFEGNFTSAGSQPTLPSGHFAHFQPV